MLKYAIICVLLLLASFLLFGCGGSEKHTITFNSNGGSSVIDVTDVKDVSVSKPADPTKDGFNFDGWFTDDALTSSVTWPYTLSSNITFYAKWSSVITYTITWEVNGVDVEIDTNVPEGSIPVYNGAAPRKDPIPAYVYSFTGWSPAVVAATANQTYVAQFSFNNRQYTITFDTRGGSIVEPITRNYYTLVYEPTEPTREGYHFVAWCNTPMCTEEVHWPFEMIDNITLYAKWDEAVPNGT